MKTFEELKDFYKSLSKEFEGYIQMSDKKLNKIFSSRQILPTWEELHKKNFILEACLFDGDRSVTIRQVNDKFLVIDEKISNFSNISKEFFIAKSLEKDISLKAKFIQVWEEKEDVNCLNMKVLKPTIQLFAGFSIGDEK
ncbi:TIGR04423 family type III CRISPR-associated protein [Aliarcobacter cibarius]|uniref:TIGR04423 family type III CRISPR-associated protein n=1 Tax=Aliarcobacter cibarius TaxID=255507 RepID=UPI0010FEB3CB|nr:TIGR04423 family type III CRISPR-associated protein [Aliarcobacter cibarius]TLT02800.1 TIGR04423 family type III CRISPR-associated protein [Aliarcobacter cibarius]